MRIRELPPFRHVDWDPDREELRRFAVAMVVGFAIIGGIVAWRHGGFAAPTFILWGAGILLALGALIPGAGRFFYLGVYLPSSLVGYVVSHMVLTLMFFLVFLPVGLAVRLTGRDLLQLRKPEGRSLWLRHRDPTDVSSYYRQF